MQLRLAPGALKNYVKILVYLVEKVITMLCLIYVVTNLEWRFTESYRWSNQKQEVFIHV